VQGQASRGISETTSGNRHRIKHPSFQFTIYELLFEDFPCRERQ